MRWLVLILGALLAGRAAAATGPACEQLTNFPCLAGRAAGQTLNLSSVTASGGVISGTAGASNAANFLELRPESGGVLGTIGLVSPLVQLTSGAGAPELRFFEDVADINYVGFKAAGTLAGDTTYTWPTAYPAVTGYVLSSTTGGAMSWVVQSGGVTAHNALTGLSADDHTQYFLLAGRTGAGGQVGLGGTASGDALSLSSTSNTANVGALLLQNMSGKTITGGAGNLPLIQLGGTSDWTYQVSGNLAMVGIGQLAGSATVTGDTNLVNFFGFIDNSRLALTGASPTIDSMYSFTANNTQNTHATSSGTAVITNAGGFRAHSNIQASAGTAALTITNYDNFWAEEIFMTGATGTVTNGHGLRVSETTGAGTLVNFWGVKVENQTEPTTKAIGFESQLTTGTGRAAFVDTGGVPSRFAGGLMLGSGTADPEAAGFVSWTAKAAGSCSAGEYWAQASTADSRLKFCSNGMLVDATPMAGAMTAFYQANFGGL